MVGLDRARKRQLQEYSKGMTRRIGLAQALINDPELILLDEPTSGLDPIGTREMKDLILRLRDQGKTIVMCSHLLADVQDVCDRIAILHQGELKELGRVDSLLTRGRRDADSRQAAEPDMPQRDPAGDRAAPRRAGERRAPDDDARRAVPVDRPRQRSAARRGAVQGEAMGPPRQLKEIRIADFGLRIGKTARSFPQPITH